MREDGAPGASPPYHRRALAEVLGRDPWWASWFGEEYLALYPERDDAEAQRQAWFALELLSPYARRGRLGILDLACGTGRHAVVLAEGSRRVVGLDLSAHLLGEARRRGEHARLAYLRGDMRRLPFSAAAFGAVVNFFTSFGYFESPDDDLAVLREVARVLGPGGAFLSDLFNAERVLATLVSREEKTVAGERVSISRRYDPATRKVEKEIVMSGGGPGRTFRERVRAYGPDELRDLHARAGLVVERTFGDFDGSPFHPRRSPRLIQLAVKASNA